VRFKPGDEVVYSKDLGAHSTFYRWRDDAVDAGEVVQHSGRYFMAPTRSGCVLTTQ
jgi:hypothetical protein